MSCVSFLVSRKKKERKKKKLITFLAPFTYFTTHHTDFGNVENPPPVAVHSHPKSLCAHRAREDRTGHHHALLDSCAGQRCHGTRAIQGGAGVHARSAEEYEEACVSKTGQACKARVDCLTTYVYNISFRRECIYICTRVHSPDRIL